MVSNLAARIDALERVAQTSEPVSDSNTSSTITKLASEVRELAAKCDDSENRQRRCNLIFFGMPDTEGETWAESKSRVMAFCSESLGVTLDRDAIERAHRLGHFQGTKNRPIIVKLGHLKIKLEYLWLDPNLKALISKFVKTILLVFV